MRGALARAGLVRRFDANRGHGLFAARDLPNGYRIALPRRFVLSASNVRRSAACRHLPRTLGDTQTIVAALADARFRNARSPWRACPRPRGD